MRRLAEAAAGKAAAEQKAAAGKAVAAEAQAAEAASQAVEAGSQAVEAGSQAVEAGSRADETGQAATRAREAAESANAEHAEGELRPADADRDNAARPAARQQPKAATHRRRRSRGKWAGDTVKIPPGRARPERPGPDVGAGGAPPGPEPRWPG